MLDRLVLQQLSTITNWSHHYMWTYASPCFVIAYELAAENGIKYHYCWSKVYSTTFIFLDAFLLWQNSLSSPLNTLHAIPTNFVKNTIIKSKQINSPLAILQTLFIWRDYPYNELSSNPLSYPFPLIFRFLKDDQCYVNYWLKKVREQGWLYDLIFRRSLISLLMLP